MNGLHQVRRSSLLLEPFQASRPPTALSGCTEKTESTVQGLGSHSGRVIYAFGEAALRAIEILIIRRRLNTIASFFPHEDKEVEDLTAVYDDVLELARPGAYPLLIVGKHALRMLLPQVASCQTSRLVEHLSQWPTVEVTLFLSDILTCMPRSWLPPSTKSTSVHRNLTYSYLSHQSGDKHPHPAYSLLKFVLELAEGGVSMRQAIINSGFLDSLLCIYAAHVEGDRSHNLPEWPKATEDRGNLLDAGRQLLRSLSREPESQSIIASHPICVLWPKDEHLISIYGYRVTERERVWRELGVEMVSRRMYALEVLWHAKRTGKTFIELADASIDALEFSRENVYGTEIANRAKALAQELQINETLNRPEYNKH